MLRLGLLINLAKLGAALASGGDVTLAFALLAIIGLLLLARWVLADTARTRRLERLIRAWRSR